MYKKIITIILCIVFVLSMFAVCVAAKANTQQLDFEAIDNYIKREMKNGKIPGLALGIVRGDSTVYLKGYGYAEQNRQVDEKTPFLIGSISKTFTALAIRQLINEGKLDEHAYVQEYIRGFKPTYQGRVQIIRIDQLLTHTSGFSNLSGNEMYLLNPKYSSKELVDIAGQKELNRLPGSSYEYSNLNYLVLGLIVEKVSGMSYETYIQKNIFDKLDMKKSYLDEGKAIENGMALGHNYFFGFPLLSHFSYPKGFVAQGYYISTAEDMAHYLICYLNKGFYISNSIIPKNSFEAPSDPLVDSYKDFWYSEYWHENFGYPKADLYLNYYSHDGSTPNYTSSMHINQKSRYGVIVLTNSRDQSNFFKPEVASWTISKGLIEYLETGRLPPETTIKGSYNRIISAILIFGLIILYAVFSIKYFNYPKRKCIRVLGLLCGLVLDFILPISEFILKPIQCDISWGFLLASDPEKNYLTIVSILLLVSTGIIKSIIYININYCENKKPSLRA